MVWTYAQSTCYLGYFGFINWVGSFRNYLRQIYIINSVDKTKSEGVRYDALQGLKIVSSSYTRDETKVHIFLNFWNVYMCLQHGNEAASVVDLKIADQLYHYMVGGQTKPQVSLVKWYLLL